MNEEIPLGGGRYTVGVVRVGETVRRPAGESSGFVRILLTHLERMDFAGAPRFLGIDENGRDILSFIPGWVPSNFQKFSDDQVRSAGALLKRFHDATVGCNPTGTHKVVCHHDPGPNNTVFENGQPVAFIDYDFAAPGNPIEDIGYMAWSWCVSSKPERGPVEFQAHQVRILVESYGLEKHDRIDVVNAIMARQSRNILFWRERIDGFNGVPTSRETILDRIKWSQQELDFTTMHREVFVGALK